MSKNHYIVNCYTCQHNGQETCKGCRTLLVGDDEPYENWQLREDLETKDQKIADLEAKLAELNKEPLNCSQLENGMSLCIIQKSEITELKQQLAEKDAELETMKQTLVDREETIVFADKTIKGLNLNHNQDKISFAVTELNKFKQEVLNYVDKVYGGIEDILDKEDLDYILDNQIKQLKEMK